MSEANILTSSSFDQTNEIDRYSYYDDARKIFSTAMDNYIKLINKHLERVKLVRDKFDSYDDKENRCKQYLDIENFILKGFHTDLNSVEADIRNAASLFEANTFSKYDSVPVLFQNWDNMPIIKYD